MAMQHDIRNWYAIGATGDGINILEALGFKKVTDNNGKKGYILETKREPVRLIGMFLRGIEDRKA